MLQRISLRPCPGASPASITVRVHIRTAQQPGVAERSSSIVCQLPDAAAAATYAWLAQAISAQILDCGATLCEAIARGHWQMLVNYLLVTDLNAAAPAWSRIDVMLIDCRHSAVHRVL